MSATDEEPQLDPVWDRTTAPQSQFTNRQVGIGFFVLVLGLCIILGLPMFIG